MSAQHPLASWRGQRSTWIGSPAGSGPLPGSCPLPCQTDATITSGGHGAPCAAHASRRTKRTSSARSNLPFTSRRPSAPGWARASSSDAAAIPASAARCAIRMPSSSTGVFERRRSSIAASSTVRTIPSSRRRSPSASGKSAGTIASLMPISRTARSLDLTARFVHRQSALDELLVAELEVVEQLGVGQLALHAVRSRGASSGRTDARRPRRRAADRRSGPESRAAARRNAPCPRRVAAHACAGAYRPRISRPERTAASERGEAHEHGAAGRAVRRGRRAHARAGAGAAARVGRRR